MVVIVFFFGEEGFKGPRLASSQATTRKPMRLVKKKKNSLARPRPARSLSLALVLTLATSGAPLEWPTPMTVIVPLALPEQSAMAFTAPRDVVELTLIAPDLRGGTTGGTMPPLLSSPPCAEAEREQARTRSTAARTAKRRRRRMAFVLVFGEDEREVKREDEL